MRLCNKYLVRAMLVTALAANMVGCSVNKNAKYYYKEGMEYFQKGDYDSAKENLETAIEKNSNKAEYYINYGFALIKTGDFEEAINQFQKVILDKDNRIVLENNKAAYRGIGIAYYEASDYENAIKAYEKALKIEASDNLDEDILSYKAESEENSGNYQEAIKTYTLLIDSDKASVNNYCSRAYSYGKIGEYDKATKDYDTAIKLNDKNYDAYFGKYFLLLEQGDQDSANDVLNNALKIKNKDNKNNYNIGKIYYYLEDYDTAKEELTTALEDEPAANFYLGEIAQQEKDYKQAITYYEAYCDGEASIKSGMVYNQLGVCYLKEGEYDKALTAFQTGVGLNDSQTIQALKFNEIVAYEKLIEFDKALEKINEYVKLYPEDETALSELEFIKTRVSGVSEDEANNTESDSSDSSDTE